MGVNKATKFDAESFGDGIVGFRLPESVVAEEAEGEKAEPPKTKGSRSTKRKSAA